MPRALTMLLLAIGVAALGYAIEPGNTEKQVLAVLGKPNATRNTPNGVLWKFKDGTSVLLQAGVVREVDGPGAAKEVPNAAEAEVTASNDSVPHPAATVAPAKAGAVTPTPARVVPRNVSPRTAAEAAPAHKTSAVNAGPAATVPVTKADSPSAAVPSAKTGPMRYVGFAVVVIATLLLLVCKVLVLIVAFKEGVGWGLGCIFVPLVTLIFIITHWDDTKKILAYQLLAGVPLLVLGAFLIA